LSFAASTGAAIIDHDSEFQYDGRPVAALQSLNASNIIFNGGHFAAHIGKMKHNIGIGVIR
jgi:GntR family transcriptional regulator / MocR family aminotransferase